MRTTAARSTRCQNWFWPDIEFYHDKRGLTDGWDSQVGILKNGLCGIPNSHLRREAIPETVKVFPLQKNGVIHGAVLSGEHYFYVKESKVPAKVLDQYAGRYNAPKSATLTVTRSNRLLILTVRDKKFELHPESDSVLFTTDHDWTFEFVKEGTKVSKFVVR